jgi:hypothetical protein
MNSRVVFDQPLLQLCQNGLTTPHPTKQRGDGAMSATQRRQMGLCIQAGTFEGGPCVVPPEAHAVVTILLHVVISVNSPLGLWLDGVGFRQPTRVGGRRRIAGLTSLAGNS